MQDNFEYLHFENFLTLQKLMIYFIKKLDQKLVILVLGQFDYFVILVKSI
jgi:hypothetical protein